MKYFSGCGRISSHFIGLSVLGGHCGCGSPEPGGSREHVLRKPRRPTTTGHECSVSSYSSSPAAAHDPCKAGAVLSSHNFRRVLPGASSGGSCSQQPRRGASCRQWTARCFSSPPATPSLPASSSSNPSHSNSSPWNSCSNHFSLW